MPKMTLNLTSYAIWRLLNHSNFKLNKKKTYMLKIINSAVISPRSSLRLVSLVSLRLLCVICTDGYTKGSAFIQLCTYAITSLINNRRKTTAVAEKGLSFRRLLFYFFFFNFKCISVEIEAEVLFLPVFFFSQVSVFLLEWRMCVLLPPLHLSQLS